MKQHKINTEEERLLFRKGGIGGSDIANISDKCSKKYHTKIDVYLDKINPSIEYTDNEYMYWGRELEALVAKKFELVTGKKVQNNNSVLIDDEYPFFYANIDRKVIGEKALLECKTTNAFMKSEWEHDHIPDNYLLQLQWYLGVTGYDKAYIACLIGGNEFVWKVCERNEELIKDIRQEAKHFWEEYVMKNVLPPVELGDEENLINIYEPNPNEKDLSDILDTLNERARINGIISETKEQLKPYEEHLKQLDLEIKDYMQGYETGICNQYTVSNKIVISNRVDTKLLKEKYPEIAKEVMKETKSNKFSVKEF